MNFKFHSDHVFNFLSLLFVGVWIVIFILNPPYSTMNKATPPNSQKEQRKNSIHQNKIAKNRDNDIIILKTRVINSSGTFYVKRPVSLSQSVAYVDMWRSHWCTYYNDREFFFTPRINELLQKLRRFMVPIVHISLAVDAFHPNSKQRLAGLKAIKNGTNDILESFNARAAKYHKDYIPGFLDECVYDDQERFGKERDNRFTKAIAIAENDYFVSNFKESAESFVGLGKKTVFIFGQHTNMCLMAVFLYCQQVGLDLILVRDLVDTAWMFKYQKNHSPTHTSGNFAVNNYFDKTFGCSVISYDLIHSLNLLSYKHHYNFQPKYTMYKNSAFMFSNL